ncbi:MAG TPA: hypothetical protein VFK07_00840 [Candidatus Paceibacterota bacterium]|nr:hypothetical protein [Candidatus Paceibacterota bacterium]
MFYPNSSIALRCAIKHAFPKAEPEGGEIDQMGGDREGQERIAAYLLWMLERIQTFEASNPNDHEEVVQAVAKRARWLAYVQGRTEALGWISNRDNRLATREDVRMRAY